MKFIAHCLCFFYKYSVVPGIKFTHSTVFGIISWNSGTGSEISFMIFYAIFFCIRSKILSSIFVLFLRVHSEMKVYNLGHETLYLHVENVKVQEWGLPTFFDNFWKFKVKFNLNQTTAWNFFVFETTTVNINFELTLSR